MYYDDKLDSLRDIFGSPELELGKDCLLVGKKRYPIVDDVIILLEPDQYPAALKARLAIESSSPQDREEFAEDIQYTFGEEWKTYNRVLPEHEREFHEYFDIVDPDSLKNARVCDLGCGIGRWAYFLQHRVGEMVLVDFSEAIFEARRNLADADNALFFMADLKCLPFRDDFADFLYCLGVLGAASPADPCVAGSPHVVPVYAAVTHLPVLCPGQQSHAFPDAAGCGDPAAWTAFPYPWRPGTQTDHGTTHVDGLPALHRPGTFTGAAGAGALCTAL